MDGIVRLRLERVGGQIFQQVIDAAAGDRASEANGAAVVQVQDAVQLQLADIHANLENVRSAVQG